MGLILYERVGHEGRRPSPFSWRIRYALTHKGVDVDYIPTRFADVETIRNQSGQHMVPILVDGDRVVHDSWNIAVHLDGRFPDRPALFGGEAAQGMARFINRAANADRGGRSARSSRCGACVAPFQNSLSGASISGNRLQ